MGSDSEGGVCFAWRVLLESGSQRQLLTHCSQGPLDHSGVMGHLTVWTAACVSCSTKPVGDSCHTLRRRHGLLRPTA